ncbi:unnamed protein product [Polarella glacialis]|nr:unnamed protein product [Polarella glacialis]
MTGPPKITASVPLDMSGIIEVKQLLVTIEELYWVNVTKEKPNKTANATSNKTANATDDAKGDKAEGDEAKAEGDEAEGEESKEAETATENATENATEDDAEPEVTWKQKKKKHEKKLTMTRMDYNPKPLTEARIKELKKKMEDQGEKEAEVGALAGLKNGLEAAIYGSRDKLEKDEIIKVSTEPQREEVTKLCNELEEQDWTGLKKTDYENQLKTLQDLLGPLEERALEYEARADLPDTVKEALDAVKQMQAHIAKNMSWVNSSKTEAAEKKTDELKEWWSKRTTQQKELPLSEAPAYTKVDVLEKLSKLKKEWQKIMKLKKPKEVKPKKGKASNATSADDSAKAEEPAVPGTVEEVEKELAELREKKIAAVENEDFDAAHVLKQREQALVKQLAKLKEDGEAAEKPDSSEKPEL